MALVGGLCVQAQKTYQVGDIYNENGVKGIVVKTSDGGRHGLIMSLKFSKDKWLKDKDVKFSTGAFDEEDGAKNTEAIAKYISENGKTWEDFPLFNWCRSLGEGWYIPAKEEMNIILIALNGDSEKADMKRLKAFDKLIRKAKGKSLFYKEKMMPVATDQFLDWLTSTETENGKVYSFWLQQLDIGGINKFMSMPRSKTFNLGHKGTRAIHKF